MTKSEKLSVQLDIIKLEISILNDRINKVIDRAWKIRQIGLALWIASVSAGIGVIHQNSEPSLTMLIISIIIPVWFFIIDSVYARWRRVFAARESAIQNFLNDDEYLVQSTKQCLSFSKCLKANKLSFPVFDLNGRKTFGDSGFYRWRKGWWINFTFSVPLLVYGSQFILSIYFACFQFKQTTGIRFWWAPALIVMLLLTLLHIAGKFKSREFRTDPHRTW